MNDEFRAAVTGISSNHSQKVDKREINQWLSEINCVKTAFKHNYSFIEIFHYLQESKTSDQIKGDITDVITAFVNLYPEEFML